jgi:Leucine-rich repeat (LRR) protein
VNTDDLYRRGIQVVEGETQKLEIRLRRMIDGKLLPHPLPNQQVTQESEREAAAAINRLGGWVAEEEIDGVKRVVAVNMVYHQDERLGRLDNPNLSDEALSHVRKFTNLKRLFLKETQATDSALANIRGMESLEQVMIWDAPVTDVGAAHLATLPNVTQLHVGDAQLTDDALQAFSQMRRVESLSLQGNHFTDRGLEYVKDMTQLKSLVIGLGKTQISNDGLRHLARLTALESLDLQGSTVTDAGLEHLTGLTKLRRLMTSRTAVTPAGIEKLRAFAPNLPPVRQN